MAVTRYPYDQRFSADRDTPGPAGTAGLQEVYAFRQLG